VVLYLFLFVFSNIEIVRDQAEDLAFDFVNYTYLDTKEEYIEDIPNIQLFKVDEMYLKINNLMDKDGETTFGYSTPRDKLAQMIDTLDKIEKDKQPKILFLDYDFSFTSTPYGKINNLSKEDQILIDTLKQKREYTIILPKSSQYNFIEHSKDTKIQELINAEKIIFASVRFSKNKDKYYRRYYSSETYNCKIYPNVSLVLFALMHNQSLEEMKKIEQNKSDKDKKDIVRNRIIIKQYKVKDTSTPIKINDNIYQNSIDTSYWGNMLKSKSALYLEDKNTRSGLKDSIVFIGATYQNSGDFFNINGSLAMAKLSGIEMHINTLMSILYYDKYIEPINIILGLILIFSLFFIVEIILEVIFEKFNITSKELEFVILLIVMSIIMYSLSIYLIQYDQIWFNWFRSILLFQVCEVIEFIRRYIVKKMAKKRG